MTVLMFGVAKDWVGERELTLCAPLPLTVEELKKHLENRFPRLKDLGYRIAVNQIFSEANEPISELDELAVIPPVSGG